MLLRHMQSVGILGLLVTLFYLTFLKVFILVTFFLHFEG